MKNSRKKYAVIIVIAIMLSMGLAACGEKTDSVSNIPEENGQDYFNVKVLEVEDNYLKVECLEITSGAITKGTQLSVTMNVASANEVPDVQVGDEIRVVFSGVMETYPPQLQTVWAIYLLDEDGNVVTDGKNMESSVDEKEDEGKKNWGITLSVENVTSSGLTLICTQSGGEPTGELDTGSDYHLLVLENDTWKDVPTVIEEYGWTSEAYIIPMGGSREFEINWEWLYGKLPAGNYRIVKGFMDFRETGDYDIKTYFAEFEIK